jgi:large subunit ribosomal protein L3
MIPAILGKKVGMTQVYKEDGRVVPATVVEAGPCLVLQVRTKEQDGYEAVQLGFDSTKPARSTRAMIGHCARANAGPRRFIREFRMAGASQAEVGQTVVVDVFEENKTKYVDVVGTSKGRGFQGVMKRYGFGGQPNSHGTERKHRSPGSIGSHASNRGTGKIKKGKRMAGHMGNARCTVRNQELVGVIKDQNLMLIRGVVPGPAGGYLMIRASKTKR